LFDINEFTSGTKVATQGFNGLVINDPAVTVLIALNIEKLVSPLFFRC